MMSDDSPQMSTSKFNDKGNYRTAEGTDELQGVEGVSLSLPKDTEGLSDYQEGDECDITVKGRVGATDEDGNVPIEVINLDLKAMPGEAKMFRRDEKDSMPPPETMGKDSDAGM